MKLTAKVYFEVEVGVSGTFVAGYPASGPTYSSGGEPGETDGVQDVEIGRFGGLKRELSPPEIRGSHMWTDRFVDLLDGIDPKCEAYAKLMSNILAFVATEADDALIAEGVDQ